MRARGTPLKKIVIVRMGEPVDSVAATRGQFSDLIAQSIGDAFDGAYAEVDVRTETPPNPGDATAFILTGSAANVPTRAPWIVRTEAWLREVVAMRVPTLGICFGHQILAQALGGQVVKNPRGREIGTMTIQRSSPDPIFDGVPPIFDANVTHIDTVAELPPGALCLARSPLDDNQVLRFTENCYGFQFHPEIDAEVMRAYVVARTEVLTAEGFAVDRLFADINGGDGGRRMMRNFVQQHVNVVR